jgi:putative ABC transport system substrate-binding protein
VLIGLTGLGASAAGLALVAGYESALLRYRASDTQARVGFLTAGTAEPYFADIMHGLNDYGWIEDLNLAVERRVASSVSQLQDLAAELTQLPVGVIIAVTTDDALAAWRATRTTPIVMVAVADALTVGLIASLGKPGGNVTGLTNSDGHNSPDAKRLELLKSLVPTLSRVAVLADRTAAGAPVQVEAVRSAAALTEIQVDVVEAATAAEIAPAFQAAADNGDEALLSPGGSLFAANAQQIAALALQHRLPSIYTLPDYTQAGGLMSFRGNVTDQSRRVAYYVDRILRGARPADLPVELPRTFDLVVNLRTARALGITFPAAVAAQVTEWIQ